MKSNKSQIFSKAWELFKKYDITFSQALKKSWSDFKRQFYISIYNKISLKPQFSKKRLEAKKMYQKFDSVNFEMTLRNICNNKGASSYYDGLTLNMD